MVDENLNDKKYWEVPSFWKNDVQPTVPGSSNEMYVPYL